MKEVGYKDKDLRYLIMSTHTFHNGGQTDADGEICSSVLRIVKTKEEAINLVRTQFRLIKEGWRKHEQFGMSSYDPEWIPNDNEYWQETAFKYKKSGPYGCSWDCQITIITDYIGNFDGSINDLSYLF